MRRDANLPSLHPTTRAVAAHGLVGASSPPVGPLDDRTWHTLWADVERERIIGLLASAVAVGQVDVTPEQHRAVETAHRTAMVRALEIEPVAVRVVRALRAAHVEHRLLKGLATAHLDLPDPSWRAFADVDLLVPGEHLAHATRVLEGMGAVRDLPERRAGFDRRFGKEITYVVPGSVEVDVHRTLVLGAFGIMIPMGEVWAASHPFVLGGETVFALSREHRVLHAALAAVLGDRRPRAATLRDLAQLLDGDVDHGAVIDAAHRWRAAAPVAAAARVCADVLGVGASWALLRWANAYEPTSRERLLLRAYESFGGSNTTVLLSGVVPLHRVDRLRYLQALVLPRRSYRAARRAAGRPSEWRQGLAELVGRGAKP